MWPVHIPKLATFQAYCFLSFHPHKHMCRHHCHQQPPPTTITWPPQQPLCTPTTTTMDGHDLACATSSKWWQPMLSSLSSLFQVSSVSPQPLSFFHMRSRGSLCQCSKQWPGTSTDMPHRLGGDNACRHHCPHCYRWAAPIFFFISDVGGHIALAMWQPSDTGQTMSDNNDKWLHSHHHSESLHPTSSLPHPTNIPPPPDKEQWPQPCHPSPATISHDHNWSWSQQRHDKMTMQQPQHDNITHWPLASPLLFCSHFLAIILDSHSSTM